MWHVHKCSLLWIFKQIMCEHHRLVNTSDPEASLWVKQKSTRWKFHFQRDYSGIISPRCCGSAEGAGGENSCTVSRLSILLVSHHHISHLGFVQIYIRRPICSLYHTCWNLNISENVTRFGQSEAQHVLKLTVMLCCCLIYLTFTFWSSFSSLRLKQQTSAAKFSSQ